MIPSDELSFGEELVLQVFKLRRIRNGYGLFYDIFRIELKDHAALDLPAAVVSLLKKDYLQADPNIHAFYILTKKGFSYISQTP
jgi:hypothetical protein